MRRRHVVFDFFCDICGSVIEAPYGVHIAPLICGLCGKEVCQNCARFLCSKPLDKSCSGGSGMIWTGYDQCNHKEEFIICVNCTDKLKLSLHIAANKKGV